MRRRREERALARASWCTSLHRETLVVVVVIVVVLCLYNADDVFLSLVCVQCKPLRPDAELIFPPALMSYEPRPLTLRGTNATWHRPTSMTDLLALKAR